METEFYKSIPTEIRKKLGEYVEKLNGGELTEKHLPTMQGLAALFEFERTIEGHGFWYRHYKNNTFPIWSDELNRFIDPPTNIDINENPNKFYPL